MKDKTAPGEKEIQKITTKQELIKSNKTKHNYKLTEEDIKDIMLYYYLDNRKQTRQEILDKYNISARTYYNIIKDKKNIELINKDINAMKQNFTKKSQIIIDKALNKINKNIDSGEVNNKDLITITGILYDKTRLENNLSTQNNAISINIKIE